MDQYKYLKYRTKNMLFDTLKSEPDIKSIKSILTKYYDAIHVHRPHDKSKPAILWFGDNNGVYQSMYNVYDIDKFYLSYMSPLYTFLNYVDKLNDILIIGLGGGHLVMLLQKYFLNTLIDVVEIDGSVVQAAKYMGFAASDKTKIYINDGWQYISITKKKYDVVIIDLDDMTSFDPSVFSNISNILAYSGVLAINYYHSNATISVAETLSNKLTPFFLSMKIYKLGKNFVYICKVNSYVFPNSLTYSNINQFLRGYKYIDNLMLTVNSIEYVNI